MRSLDIAGTGMQAQQTNVEVISNNIANMTTTGFKRRRAEFQDLIYQNLRRVGSNSSDSGTIVPSGAQVGLGVKTAAIYSHQRAGQPAADFEHAGHGDPGQWIFPGHACRTERPPIPATARSLCRPTAPSSPPTAITVQPGLQIPSAATGVTINTSGQVQVTIQGQTAPQTIGQLQLATFPNEAGLDAQGGNLFLQTAASGAPVTGNPGTAGFGSVKQGFIETSNVNVVTEITNLITAQRAYEMNSKVITSSDEMMSTLTNLR